MSCQPDYISRYELETMKTQMFPARLNSRVFFGPLNSITNLSFLTENNIKHIVTVNIPTTLCMKYCEKIPMNIDEYTLLTLDSNLPGSVNGMDDALVRFSQVFSNNIKNFVKSQLPDSMNLLYSTSSLNYLASNIITCEGYEKLVVFNDFLALVQNSSDLYGNALIVSSNGNDDSLVALLSSAVLKDNINLQLNSVIQHLQMLRPSMKAANYNKIQYSQGFIQYCELIKSKCWKELMKKEQINRERKALLANRNSSYKREEPNYIEASNNQYYNEVGDDRSFSENKMMTPTCDLDHMKQEFPDRVFKKLRYSQE